VTSVARDLNKAPVNAPGLLFDGYLDTHEIYSVAVDEVRAGRLLSNSLSASV
jgi:hypothetical protein